MYHLILDFTYSDVVFVLSNVFSRPLIYFVFILTKQTPNLSKTRTLSPPTFQLMPFLLDNIEVRLRYGETDFHEHGERGPHT